MKYQNKPQIKCLLYRAISDDNRKYGAGVWRWSESDNCLYTGPMKNTELLVSKWLRYLGLHDDMNYTGLYILAIPPPPGGGENFDLI